MKDAVEVLTRHWAKELGAHRVAVNTVPPGAIARDFSGGMVRENPAVNKLVADMMETMNYEERDQSTRHLSLIPARPVLLRPSQLQSACSQAR